MLKGKAILILSLIFIAGTVIIILSALKNPLSPATSIPQGKTYEVMLDNNGFSPPEIEIKQGDLVKFSSKANEPFWPASDLHPTHGIYPEFDPQEPIEPTQSWTFQFLKSGRWKYHDHLHPAIKGIIVVK